jgi:hypothetical protein
MMQTPQQHISPRHAERTRQWRRATEFFAGYFWFIFKNVIGWLLIISSLPVGIALPGPGGIPLFLIGFGLVTFPGKRRLTSRVMRGRGLPIEMQVFTFLTAFFAIAGTCIFMWFVADYVDAALQTVNLSPKQKGATYAAIMAGLLVTGLIALGVTWLVMRLALQVVNYVLRGMPMIRRKARPWLRSHGFNLLPSRHKRALEVLDGNGDGSVQPGPNEEILEIDQRYENRLRSVGTTLWPWIKRAVAVAITIGVFLGTAWLTHLMLR